MLATSIVSLHLPFALQRHMYTLTPYKSLVPGLNLSFCFKKPFLLALPPDSSQFCQALLECHSLQEASLDCSCLPSLGLKATFPFLQQGSSDFPHLQCIMDQYPDKVKENAMKKYKPRFFMTRLTRQNYTVTFMWKAWKAYSQFGHFSCPRWWVDRGPAWPIEHTQKSVGLGHLRCHSFSDTC